MEMDPADSGHVSAIKVDFWNDCVESMRAQLRGSGHSPPSDAIEVAAHFLNLQRRRVEARPRLVSVASGIQVPAHRRAGYETLMAKLVAGDDVNSHLSRSVLRDANYDDPLLNDWGMHHFHLGVQTDADGFVERTDELVFAIVHWDRAYIVGIGSHGEWAEDWLIDSVHKNWPELLTPLALHPGTPHSPHLHLRARRSGLWPVTVLRDGTPVMGPGGGYATSGRSIRVTMRVGRMRQVMAALQERFMSVVPQLETHIRENNLSLAPEFHLTTTPEGAYVAVDTRCGLEVPLCTPEEARDAFGS